KFSALVGSFGTTFLARAPAERSLFISLSRSRRSLGAWLWPWLLCAPSARLRVGRISLRLAKLSWSADDSMGIESSVSFKTHHLRAEAGNIKPQHSSLICWSRGVN